MRGEENAGKICLNQVEILLTFGLLKKKKTLGMLFEVALVNKWLFSSIYPIQGKAPLINLE